MKVARTAQRVVAVGLAGSVAFARSAATASAPGQPPHSRRRRPVAKLVAEPASLTMRAGESVDAQGHGVRRGGQSRFPTRSCASTCRGGRASFADGKVTGVPAGTFVADRGRGRRAGRAAGHARDSGHRRLAGARVARDRRRAGPALHRRHARARAPRQARRRQRAAGRSSPTWRSSDPTVATRRSLRQRHRRSRPGAVTITARARRREGREGRTPSSRIRWRRSTSASPKTTIRTGDVIQLAGAPKRADGAAVDRRADHVELHLPRAGRQHARGAGRRGHHRQRPVRRRTTPGCYTILAQSGAAHARKTIEVTPRDVRQRHHGDRPRHHPRHAHVRPLAVHRQGRPRLLHRRHVGRRRLRARLRHHRPHEHRQDRLDQGRRAHDQRRDRVARRALRACCRARARRIASTAS